MFLVKQQYNVIYELPHEIFKHLGFHHQMSYGLDVCYLPDP